MTGHCLCNKVTIKLDGDFEIVRMCMCESCRRKTGSAYDSGGFINKDLVTITGQDNLTEYKRTKEISEFFCKDCGSHIYSFKKVEQGIDPILYNICLGIIDGPFNFKIDMIKCDNETASWINKD